MQKLALIIGSALLLAGVAAAGTFAAGLGSANDNPTLSTKPPATTIRDVRREDRRDDRATEAEARGRANEVGEDARGRANEPGEDVRGPEAEPNDDRGGVVAPTTTATQADDNPVGADDSSGPSSSSGPGSSSSGHGGSGEDDSGHGGHDD